MEKQTQEIEAEQEEGKKDSFFHKNNWLISAIFGVLTILSLLGTVVTYTIKLEDGTKLYYDVHLWDYFTNRYEFNWTMYATIGIITLGIIFALLHKVHSGFDSGAGMTFILVIPMLALTREFFSNNSIENLKSVSFGWGSACSIAFSIAAALFSITSSFADKPIKTRDIAEDGVLIAAAFILNLIKIPMTTGGGSVNFQMLPLFLIALRHGPAHGLVCGGIIYGLITCLTDGWGFATYPFDYLIGFGSVMVIGYFKKFILSDKQTSYNIKGEVFLFIACAIATAIRFVGSTASSMVVYGYSLEAAVLYNAIYIPVSGLIATVTIMFAYGPLIKINQRYPAR